MKIAPGVQGCIAAIFMLSSHLQPFGKRFHRRCIVVGAAPEGIIWEQEREDVVQNGTIKVFFTSLVKPNLSAG